MKYTADFETTTQITDCRVWCYGLCKIGGSYDFQYGYSIDELMEWCQKQRETPTLYFHNLKFDGEFIIHWLLTHGYRHVTERKDKRSKTFTTLISDKGMFYSIEIMFHKNKRGNYYKSVKILDSLKILPFSVDQIAKGFHLPELKLEMDYHKERPIGYQMDEAEKEYLKHDVLIVAKALNTLFLEGLTKMTQGSNALFNFKETLGKKKFERLFPVLDLETDTAIRQSYKGGFTYCNPKYQGKDIAEGIVLDVNSLYPSRMYYEKLPHGVPLYFEGKYQKDDWYPLYVQQFRASFELKPDHLPTIQLKNNLAFNPTEYVTSSEGELITLTMTNVDLALFFDHYEVDEIEYIGGYKFKATVGIFKEYIDHWMGEKIQAKKEGNHAMYLLSKLMLNALYGKFALNPHVRSKIPFLNEERAVRYELGEEELRDPIYIPMGTFITSYARNLTIRAAQKVYDRFCYADTDSLHLIGTDLPDDLEIDSVKLGAWDHEKTFVRARFLRAKCYIEEVQTPVTKVLGEPPILQSKLSVTCAGLPEKGKTEVTWENFYSGAVYGGKLQMVHVDGGIVLKDILFTIKG